MHPRQVTSDAGPVIAMSRHEAKFQVGEIIQHRLFDYIGVVFDVDPTFQGTEEWYQQVARSRPPRDEPWYHVLVNEAVHTTYVAEQNLAPAEVPQRIVHPFADGLFGEFDGERYKLRQQAH
jgi:heat shock protein HspQ